MGKIKTTLPMKGLRAPRILLWARGFFQGKILHSGGLDPQTNTISSGYITGQAARFYSACAARCEKVEGKLQKDWADADRLLLDLTNISMALREVNDHQKFSSESSAQARAREAASKKRVFYESERSAILKRLSDISNTVRTELDQARNQMEATAEMLMSTYAAYGHGLLMKPVYPQNLPSVRYDDCIEHILKNHEDTWNAIISIIKEAKKK